MYKRADEKRNQKIPLKVKRLDTSGEAGSYVVGVRRSTVVTFGGKEPGNSRKLPPPVSSERKNVQYFCMLLIIHENE